MRISRDDIVVASCISADFDQDYLCHFLDYYGKIASEIRIIVNSSNEESLRNFRYAKGEGGLSLVYTKWLGEFIPKKQVNKVNEQLALSSKKWAMQPDIDEHIVLPDKFPNLMTYAYGLMIDRVADDFRSKKISANESLESQFPRSCCLTRDLVKGCDSKPVIWLRNKYSLVGPHRLSVHSAEKVKKILSRTRVGPLTINHFKWTETTHEKTLVKLQRYKEKGIPIHKESRRTLTFFDENLLSKWLEENPSVHEMTSYPRPIWSRFLPTFS